MHKATFGVVMLLAFSFRAGAQKPQPRFVTTDEGILVHLHQPRSPFLAGESIRVRAYLSNNSKHTLLVCRDVDMTSDSCHWEFESRDASGRISPGWKYAADRLLGTPAPFSSALISNWIALAPKYEYGTTLDLDLAFPSKPQPGRYTVRAILSSQGPNSPSMYNDLARYPKELANLPYPGWKGKAVSNWVSITIIGAK